MLFTNSIKFGCRIPIGISKRTISWVKNLKDNPVLVSTNTDVYTNLALEHWLYSNLDFSQLGRPIVFLWKDDPSIVIGRHQNPWIEANIGWLSNAKFKLARRHSGGGCVYHDENNINISIIADRANFEFRQENLRFICQVFREKYGINCEPTKRHDIVQSATGLKVSGSAAKLGRSNCYHHLTVLVDTNKSNLRSAIRKVPQDFISTNSTASHRSDVVNLREIRSELEVDQVIADLADAFSRRFGANREIEPGKETFAGDHKEYQDFENYRAQLSSWDWIYGKTPKFKLEKRFNVISRGQKEEVTLSVHVNKGLFESIEIQENTLVDSSGKYFECLLGTPFTYRDAMVNIAKLLELDKQDSLDINQIFGLEKVYATFLLQIVHEAHF